VRSEGGGFAIWITGLPASGKSTLTRALVEQLRERGVEPDVLESDRLRAEQPAPAYDAEGRDAFYRAMADEGERRVSEGRLVIFDATANRRRYRQYARDRIARFVEVFLDCPLQVCMERDPKGIYERAVSDSENTVPGLGDEYEPPLHAELVVGANARAEDGARRVIDLLDARRYLR